MLSMLSSINQLRDFSSLFTRSEVFRWMKDDFNSIDVKLKRYGLLEKKKGKPYLSILKETYSTIEKEYPNEYILKNEFLNQWLKEEIGTTNSVIFNELRVGKAIADLAMFNGVSKVFEIKTILDKEYRLPKQIEEYKKIFNEVYIIIPKVYLPKYKNFDKTIGIILYESDSKSFNIERKSKSYSQININVMMDTLHTKEYLKICKSYYTELPKMNSFNQFDICKKLISKIPKHELNNLFIGTIKERKINNSFFNETNKEFNQICLSLNLDELDRKDLIKKLKLNTV